MDDARIYRVSGLCALASIAVFFIEFPFYLVRGPFPGISNSIAVAEYTARNARNIMSCVLLDFFILTLIVIFLAGFRHLVLRADPTLDWLASAFFAIGLVYVTLTLAADSLQAASVVDALTVPPDGALIRGMLESMVLMYGAVALFLMGAFIALGGWLVQATRSLPAWSAVVAYACSIACFAFVPSMFVPHIDLQGFYNPAGWGPTALASGLPLAVWMIVSGILMLRLGTHRRT
ncbi:MAG: hypothetical protein WBX09_03590 [Terracidiphilus sp.]